MLIIQYSVNFNHAARLRYDHYNGIRMYTEHQTVNKPVESRDRRMKGEMGLMS